MIVITVTSLQSTWMYSYLCGSISLKQCQVHSLLEAAVRSKVSQLLTMMLMLLMIEMRMVDTRIRSWCEGGRDIVLCERRRLQWVAVVKAGSRCSRCRRHCRPRLQLFYLIVAFPLHSSVLKPDLDLSLGEPQLVGQFGSTSTRQVSVEVEFLFQFERLVTRVRRASPLRVRTVAATLCNHVHRQLSVAATKVHKKHVTRSLKMRSL